MKSKSIFEDLRLDKEYEALVTQMTSSGSAVINRACPSAADKKSAYRFINNENVTVQRIVTDLVSQTVENIRTLDVKEILVAQDTMETVREHIVRRLQKGGREVLECAKTNKGMRSHSAIVMNASNGMPLGFGYLEIWGRKPEPMDKVKEEDVRADRRRKPSYYITDPETGETRYKYSIPVEERDSESARWLNAPKEMRKDIPEEVHIVMVQDREGDMYPLLTLKGKLQNFDIVVRAAKKRKVRLTDGSTQGLFEYTADVPASATRKIAIGKGPRRKARWATVDIRFGEITVMRPHSPRYDEKSVCLSFVRVTETAASAEGHAEPVDWLLLTTIAINTLEDAEKIVSYYRRRWFIEDYHRLLKKKGFGIEDIQVESPHAFEINLAVCIKSAYETALLKKGFDSKDDTTPATLVFTPLEMRIVGNLNREFNTEKKIHKNPFPNGSIAWAAWAVACEGGWSAMPSQPKPGLITFKRGIDRIETIYQYFLKEPKKYPICG